MTVIFKSKYFEIIEFHYNIWNRHGKCIRTSTNIPSIGLVIREIRFKNEKLRLHGKRKILVKLIVECYKGRTIRYLGGAGHGSWGRAKFFSNRPFLCFCCCNELC